MYDRACLQLSVAEIDQKLEKNEPYTIRLLVPSGKTVVKDLLRGYIPFSHSTLDDQVVWSRKLMIDLCWIGFADSHKDRWVSDVSFGQCDRWSSYEDHACHPRGGVAPFHAQACVIVPSSGIHRAAGYYKSKCILWNILIFAPSSAIWVCYWMRTGPSSPNEKEIWS